MVGRGVTNPPRVKGTRAESAAARWLTGELGVIVERGPLRGSGDRGDLFGVPGWTIEIKNCKAPNLKQWERELDAEMRNNGTDNGVILWSPPGVGMGRVDQWVAIEPHSDSTRVVPHIGPLNQFHRYVTTMDGWRYVTQVTTAPWCFARLAGSWVEDVRNMIVGRDVIRDHEESEAI